MSRLDEAVLALRKCCPNKQRLARRWVFRGNRPGYLQLGRAASDDELASHVLGKDMFGGIASDSDGITDVVALDVDAHTAEQKPFAATKAFCEKARAIGVPTVVHTSKSGNGFHIRTFFTSPIGRALARALYTAMLVAGGLNADRAVDKVWPPTQGYGVLALPYQGQYAKENGGTLAISQNTWTPLAKRSQLEAVLDAETLDEQDVRGLLAFYGVCTDTDIDMLAGMPMRQDPARDGQFDGIHFLMHQCAAVHRLRDEASTISRDFWFALATNFRPFRGGFELFDILSQADPARYNPKHLESMWRSIRGQPRHCDNLEIGWVCPRRDICAAKSPAGLPWRQNKEFS